MGRDSRFGQLIGRALRFWPVVLITTVLGIAIGFAYLQTFASDEDPFQKVGAVHIAYVPESVEDSNLYLDGRLQSLEAWISAIVASDELYEDIESKPAVERIYDEYSGITSMEGIEELVTVSFNSTRRSVLISVKGRSDADVKVLLDESIDSVSRILEEKMAGTFTGFTTIDLLYNVADNEAAGKGPLQITVFALLGFLIGAAAVLALVTTRDFCSFRSLVDRYTLPVFGVFLDPAEVQAGERGIGGPTARSGFPNDAVLIASGKLDALPERVVSTIREHVSAGNVSHASSIDDVAKAVSGGSDILIVVVQDTTSHSDVESTLNLLDAYGFEPKGFCMVSRRLGSGSR